MAGGFVGNFMSQSLPQKPMVPAILSRQLGERVADVNPPAGDAQSQNISPREIGEKYSIVRQRVAVLGHLDNVRRLGSDECFNGFIGNDGNLSANGTGLQDQSTKKCRTR
jgi:hypothetical protein